MFTMNKNNSFKLILLIIILSFLFGILGSVVSDRFILPQIYKNFYSHYTNNNTNATRPIIEPMKVIETTAESSIINVAKTVSPSVVSIVITKELTTYYTNPFDLFFNDPFFNDPFFNGPGIPRTPQQAPKTEKRTVGGGSGFIITQDGLVLTNKHVVDDPQADYTIITKDGTEYKAVVVTKDPLNDMAILRMETKDGKPVSNMPVVKFISNIKNIQVGQMVVAIGNALAQFDNTVTTGVISAKERDITAGGGFGTNVEQLKGLIQTDASINPGNSGGPLVSLSGEVLGINTAIASGAQGIGFAIPLDEQTINRILQQIQKYGKIVRPYLGVRYVMITPDMNKQYHLGTNQGAWIKADQDLPSVIAGTPAAKAGLKGGDIITKVDGKVLDSKYTLQDAVAEKNPGDTITLTILRDGKEQAISVHLEERTDQNQNSNQNG
jgi:serine protease Do